MSIFIESEEFIFNTKVQQKICVDNISGSEANSIIDGASTLMKEFENKLSFFNEDSDVSKINNNAGKEFVKVTSDTFEIIKQSKYYSKLTNGLFDVTIAPLVKEWGINTYNPIFVEEEKIKAILPIVSYKEIILDEENSSVMLSKEDQKMDLGGIAKGYIADKIIEFYKQNNVSSALVNIGGNVKVLGKKNDTLWNVGIKEPINHSLDSIGSINVEDLSIVTSGGYERAFMYNGELYHHILNPNTGFPAKTDLKSITIVSKDSIEGDALSTPLFIMGKYKAYEFMKNNNISGIMITDEDEVIITRDLIDKFNLLKDYKVLAC